MAARVSTPTYQWPNWLNLILAVWLFISPWVIGFAFGPAGTGGPANGAATVNHVASTAAWDAWVVAVIVAVLSIAAISRLAIWEEWVNLVVGVWLFFSPWILGYAGLRAAVWNSLIVGFLIAVLAIWGIVAARRVGTTLERVEIEPGSRI
jgi:hypothetical protein